MAELLLTQAEADTPLAIEKHRADTNTYYYPGPGTSLAIPLISADRRELFLLDINRKYTYIQRATYMNRVRSVIILARLDIQGPPHQNPDGVDIPAPHLHLYREGYHDKWAFAVPPERFSDLTDFWLTLEDFMRFCNITEVPFIERGMFV